MKNDIDKGLLNIGDVRSYIAQTFYELDKGFLTELHLPDFYDNIQIISKSFDIEYLTNSIDTNKWKIYLQSLRNDIDRYKFCNNEMLKILYNITFLQLDTIEKGILNIENLESNPKATQKQNVQEVVDNYILNTSQNDNLAQDKLDGYTDEEIEFINDYLEQFKDEGKIDDKNYDILVNALLSFINIKIFPKEKIQFNGRVNKKRVGCAIRKILEVKGLEVDNRVLRFAKNYISIYKNTKFDEALKGSQNNLYKYFHVNYY